MFHFHKAGLYGVLANLFAIPLTTFVIMPLEALALLFDIVGLGAPLWFLTGLALDGLLWIAHAVAASRGAVAMLAAMPGWALASIVVGGLWLCLWTTRPRLLANDYDVLRGVARAGFGLALLPEYQCIEDVEAGRLARALVGWSAREIRDYTAGKFGRLED